LACFAEAPGEAEGKLEGDVSELRVAPQPALGECKGPDGAFGSPPYYHQQLQTGWTLMKAPNPWITYRTRFLVKAKQLTTSLAFTDLLGRQHSGRKGDYLVESSDGVLRIAPRQIFEDIYVPLLASETPEPTEISEEARTPRQHKICQQHEALRQRETPITLSLPPHLTRKSPQPYSDRRNPSPGLRSL
jgi:hypothetical protein